jgi:hypothetical protein
MLNQFQIQTGLYDLISVVKTTGISYLEDDKNPAILHQLNASP